MKTTAIVIFWLNIAMIVLMLIDMPISAQDRYTHSVSARLDGGYYVTDWTKIYLGRLCWFGVAAVIDLAYIVLRLGQTLPKPSNSERLSPSGAGSAPASAP